MAGSFGASRISILDDFLNIIFNIRLYIADEGFFK